MIAKSSSGSPSDAARILLAEKLSAPGKKQIEVDIPGSDPSAEDGGRRLAGARAESLLAGQMPTEGSHHGETPKIQEICEGLTAGGGSPVHILDGRDSQASYQHTYDECTRMLTQELEKLNMRKFNMQ